MTSRDFCYWLQGYFELNGPGPIDAERAATIARHLNMVFLHEIDPSFGGPAEQKKLDNAHFAPRPPMPNDVKIRC